MSVDQEGKIKLVPESSVLGSILRYAAVIVNESTAPITQVQLKLEYPKFLTLSRIKPPVEYKLNKADGLISLTLPKLDGQKKLQINFYFNPIELGKGIFKNNLLYINNQDFVRTAETQQFEVNLSNRLFSPKKIPSFQISAITKNAVHKGIKSYGRPPYYNVKDAFQTMTRLIQTYNFELITKTESNGHNVAWFYGVEEKTKQEVLLIGQTLNDKMEFITISDDENLNISLLTKLSFDFRKRLFNAGDILSMNGLYELTCKFCGGIFDYYPQKGENITCKYCNKEQQCDWY